MKSFMTAAQVAEYCGVKLATIRKWTHLKYIPYTKFRGAVRYEQSQIDTWLDRQTQRGRNRIKITGSDIV